MRKSTLMEYSFLIFVWVTYRSPPSEQSSSAPNTLHKEKPPFFQQTATAVPSGVHFMHFTGPAFWQASVNCSIQMFLMSTIQISPQIPVSYFLSNDIYCDTNTFIYPYVVWILMFMWLSYSKSYMVGVGLESSKVI